MLFRSFFRPFLIFITLCLWGNALSAPKLLHDENRILSASQCHYLEKLAQELEQKTGFSMAVVLLDNNSGKHDFSPEDNELLLYTSLKQQQHLVKLGKNVEAVITTKTIERLQQEFLFPEYRMARYDKGTLQLAYHLAKELVAKKGNSLTTPPPEFEEDASLNAAGWVFVIIIFSLLFLALYKRVRRTQAVTTSSRFSFGRFGRRSRP